ncbi:MAG: hypothetical protein F6K39_07635 [Okeania sp. SIO3B3]|nr:hypothetical protein [Okeania sp. SIO3B3]
METFADSLWSNIFVILGAKFPIVVMRKLYHVWLNTYTLAEGRQKAEGREQSLK